MIRLLEDCSRCEFSIIFFSFGKIISVEQREQKWNLFNIDFAAKLMPIFLHVTMTISNAYTCINGLHLLFTVFHCTHIREFHRAFMPYLVYNGNTGFYDMATIIL